MRVTDRLGADVDRDAYRARPGLVQRTKPSARSPGSARRRRDDLRVRTRDHVEPAAAGEELAEGPVGREPTRTKEQAHDRVAPDGKFPHGIEGAIRRAWKLDRMRFVPVVRRENVVQERHGPDPLTGPGRYAGAVTVTDTLDRPLRDLRISVTDRCNFRCVYCMPKEVFGREYAFLERKELLTFEEIERVARVFVEQGVQKLRVTGGEPLIRRDLDRLIALLSALGDLDIALTTNGALLARNAERLANAGLSRVTVSLDSLDDDIFRAMNDVDFPVAQVLEGIDAAAAAGLPVKVNVVVKRGLNDGSIVDMARFFHGSGHALRFIEYMDVGHTNGWRMDDIVPAAEIVAAVDAVLPLEPVDPAYRGEVAGRYRYRDGGGEVGVIASVTQPFCGDCTRARLSADGQLYTCLFAVRGHDLRALLRSGASDDDLGDTIGGIWRRRIDRYSELRTAETASLPKVEMSFIGG